MSEQLYRNRITVLSNTTTVKRTVRQIKNEIIKSSKDSQLQLLASSFLKYPVPEKAIFDYVYSKIAYVPDEDDMQDIRTPHRSLHDKVGNCVDYTVILGTLLYILNIPFRIKVVEIEDGYGFEHVYIVTDKYALDPCLGQPQDGTAYYSRPSKGQFNQETFFFPINIMICLN